MKRGYWLTPEGKFLDLGCKHHLDFIIENPQKFGEKIEDIQEEYSRYNEGWCFECKARDEIMQRVFKRVFIRIRETKNYWKVQIWNFTADKMLIIQN